MSVQIEPMSICFANTMRSMIKILLLLAICYLLLCAGAFVFQRKLIFMPSKGSSQTPYIPGRKVEKVRIPVSDGVTLDGWWVSSGTLPYTLLWFHGNAGNIGHRTDEFENMARAGFNVLLFDYRGYGESTDSPSVDGLNKDALAAFNFLIGRGVEGGSIVPYGRSLGSGPAAYLANRREVAALILVQPMTGTVQMGKSAFPFLPVRLLLREIIDNESELSVFDGPLLVLHGDRDDIVPYSMGKRLFTLSPSKNNRFITLEGGDHNSLGHTHGKEMIESIRTFLEILSK